MYTELDQYRLDKAKRIAAAAYQCAQITGGLAPLAYPRKHPRILMRVQARMPACAGPHSHGYRSARARTKSVARAQLAISLAIGALQIACITSQPIPKYPQGAVINDNGKQETFRHGQADY